MTWKNYFIVCAALLVLIPLLVLFVPAVADVFETVVLIFLSVTAS
ncbi:MAG: hypothetical protein AB7I04_09950 [Pseudomonadales bacterium]